MVVSWALWTYALVELIFTLSLVCHLSNKNVQQLIYIYIRRILYYYYVRKFCEVEIALMETTF